MSNNLRCGVVFVALSLLSLGAARAEVVFEPAVLVENDSNRTNYVTDITVDTAGTIYAAWERASRIMFAKSTDAGSTWSENVKINDTIPGIQMFPSIRVDAQGILYVVWGVDNYGNVYCAKSTDGGLSWSNPVRVNDNASGAWTPSMAMDTSGNLYVTLTDDRSDLGDIYFTMSTDGGETWSTNTTVNQSSTGLQCFPSTAVDDDANIYVVWIHQLGGPTDIHFSMSTDSGVSWSPSVQVNDTLTAGEEDNPRITAGGGQVCVVWTDRGGGNTGVYFSKSTDGESWSTPSIQVSGGLDYNPTKPRLAVDDGSICVVYDAADDPWSLCHVYYSESFDGGDTWSDPGVRVNDESIVNARYPSIGVTPRREVCVIYTGKKENPGPRPTYSSRGLREKFIRGDADSDMDLLMSDAVYTLRYLYLPGGEVPACDKSADSDDDGTVAMSDALHTLRYLYVPGSSPPPYPFPGCGHDPSADELDCADHPCMWDR